MEHTWIVDAMNIDHTQMRYMKFGNGQRTMLIIPGLNENPATNMASQIVKEYEIFGKDYTVYLIDVRDDVPEDYTLMQMAEDYVSVIKGLGLSDIYLFGTSMGGMESIYIAGTYPELVKKLGVGSSECKTTELLDQVVRKWIDLARAGDGLAFAESEVDYCFSENTKKQRWAELTLPGKDLTIECLSRFSRIAKCIIGFDFSKQAAAIQCPALLMGSDGDRIMSRESMEETAKMIGCETYFYGKEYGHVVYDEAAPDFQERLYEFFNEEL